jgi:hypothetical protein
VAEPTFDGDETLDVYEMTSTDAHTSPWKKKEPAAEWTGKANSRPAVDTAEGGGPRRTRESPPSAS